MGTKQRVEDAYTPTNLFVMVQGNFVSKGVGQEFAPTHRAGDLRSINRGLFRCFFCTEESVQAYPSNNFCKVDTLLLLSSRNAHSCRSTPGLTFPPLLRRSYLRSKDALLLSEVLSREYVATFILIEYNFSLAARGQDLASLEVISSIPAVS